MNTYPIDEIKKETLKYFNGDELARDVWIKKYCLKDSNGNHYEKTPDDMHRRLAKEFARIESNHPNPLSEEAIYKLLDKFKFIVPQGSPMSGIGNDFQVVSISNCFVEGTKVFTSKGVKNIEDVKYGDLVNTQNGYQKPVIQLHKNKLNNRKLFNLKVYKTPNLVVTDNHKFLSISKEQLEWELPLQENAVEYLRKGDYIAIPNQKSFNDISEFDISDLFSDSFSYEEKDYIINQITESTIQISTTFLIKLKTCYKKHTEINKCWKIDTDFMYFIGLWYGDGCIFSDRKGKGIRNRTGKHKNGVRGITFTFGSHEKELVKFVTSYGERLFGKTADVNTFPNQNTIQIVFHSAIIGIAFEKLFGRYSHGKKLNEEFFNLNNELINSFTQGLIDSDGTITKQGDVRVVLANKPLVREIFHLLRNRDIVVGYCEIKNTARLDFQKNSPFILKSNKQYNDNRIENLSTKPKSNLYTINYKGYTLLKIQNKTYSNLNPEYVYTLGVQDIHSYSVEGLISMNCFVVGNEYDSYGGILNTDQEQIQLMKRRGGVGHDLSHIRPKGSPVKNSALTSTGVVPFMERYSNSTREVAQDGRRGALMLSISIKHPDAEDFINAKLIPGKITGANISVKVDDEFMSSLKTVYEGDETFYIQRYPIDLNVNDYYSTDEWEKLKNDLEYNALHFIEKGKYVKKVDPTIIWNKLVNNVWKSAEPGLLFWDTIIKESPADSYGKEWKTTSTNPSLRADTLVLTKDGVFPIKDLDGKDIIVRNILGEWQPAKAFMSGKDKDLWEIEFTNGQRLYATAEHKHPIFNTKGKIIPSNGKVIKKRTDELKRGHKFYLPTFNETPINVSNSYDEKDGFVSGWITGDGWVSWHKNQNSFLYGFIFSNEDRLSNIDNIVLEKLNSKLNRKVNLRENKGCFEVSSLSEKIDTYFRKDIGLTHKSNGLPDYIWKSNDSFIKGYVDGIFSSDGHIDSKRNRLVLTSKYEKLLSDVQKLLGFYGIRSNIKMSFTKSNFDKNKKYRRFDLLIHTKHSQKFAKLFTLTHKRKNTELQKILTNDIGKFANERDYLVVKKVTNTNKKEDVYDITVFDNTHTFQISHCITGNCGEIPLNPYDSCRLLAINLFSYVINPFLKDAIFDFDLFKDHVRKAQRLSDDIIDLELEKINHILNKIKKDPEPDEIKIVEKELWLKIKDRAIKGRRTGLGITGEGDMLAALGYTYGSDAAISFSEKVHKVKAIEAYKESVEMAKERGKFSFFDEEKDVNSLFIKRLMDADPELAKEMSEHGRRNVSILTIAPTGSTSMMTQTSSGIEPVFLPVYKRRRKINPQEKDVRVDFIDEVGDSWTEYNVFHHNFLKWANINGYKTDELKEFSEKEISDLVKKSPYYKSTSNDIDWIQKVKMQGSIQKWIDHSISVTVNLPSDVKEDKVSEIYKKAHEYGCKGVTIYVDGSRKGVLISDNKPKVVNEKTERPDLLLCDIHHVQANKKKFYVIVGLIDDKPYEIFAFSKKQISIPQLRKDGELIKVSSGIYNLKYNGTKIEDLAQHFDSPEEDGFTRMVSLLFRSGVPVDKVVDQIDKSYSNISSFYKAISRTLRKNYVADKEIDELCPECNSKLMMVEGCKSCSCGWSKCS